MFKFLALVASASAVRIHGGPTCSWVSKLDTSTDYGVAGGVAQHADTMNWNDRMETERKKTVTDQQASDVWRASTPGPYGPYPNCAN